MKEPHSESLANHADLESCAGGRDIGRWAMAKRRGRGEGKPESFDFLGFTHICEINRKSGRFVGVGVGNPGFRFASPRAISR